MRLAAQEDVLSAGLLEHAAGRASTDSRGEHGFLGEGGQHDHPGVRQRSRDLGTGIGFARRLCHDLDIGLTGEERFQA